VMVKPMAMMARPTAMVSRSGVRSKRQAGQIGSGRVGRPSCHHLGKEQMSAGQMEERQIQLAALLPAHQQACACAAPAIAPLCAGIT
jgi:hypothetical protein